MRVSIWRTAPKVRSITCRAVTRLAIHASKGMTRDEYEDVVDHPGLRRGDSTKILLARTS